MGYNKKELTYRVFLDLLHIQGVIAMVDEVRAIVVYFTNVFMDG